MQWRFFKLDWRYAIGELLIVTLGVLIALYVDQWSTEQSIRASEIEYIERHISDLDEDQRRLDIAHEFLGGKIPSLDLIYEDLCTTSQVDLTASEKVSLLSRGALLGFSQPFARTDTYDEMISSGNLGLIADVDVRAALMTYFTDNDRFVSRTGPRTTQYPVLFFQLVPPPSMRDNSNAEDIWARVQSANICNAVRAEQNFASFMQEQYDEWQLRKDEFLGILENYLNQLNT